MGTSLTGTTPQDTYDSLIKVTDNGPLSATAKYLTDGLGNDSALALSTSRVGIGTTTPAVLLDIVGTSAVGVKITETGGSEGRFVAGGSTTYFGTYSEHPLAILTNSSERMRIDSTGNVGIGTSSPTATLSIKPSASNNSNNLAQVTTNSEFRLQYRADETAALYIGGLGSQEGYIQGVDNTETLGKTIALNPYGGNVGIGTNAPSATLSIAGTLSVSSTITGTQGNFALGTVGGSIGSVKNLTITNTNGAVGDFAGLNFAYYNNSTNFGYVGSVLTSSATNSASDLVFGVKANTSATAVTEYMRIQAGGNVGIGTASPNENLEVYQTGTAGNNYKEGRLKIGGATSALGFTLSHHALGSGVSSISGLNNAGGENANINIGFGAITTGGVPTNNLVTITQGGYFRLNSGTGGIQFGGDTAAANALDDYEEGTWTMGVSFGGASVGVTYSENTGTYTKIGRKVTVSGILILTDKGSSTGQARITGLPFTIGATAGYLSTASMLFVNITFANQFQAYGELNSTAIVLSEITEAGAYTVLNDSNFINSSEIIVSFTYFV